ncbi:MAG: efflux RND transporter periplasmic adaptor subunit [Chloroflexi bacterium]|nr:efflux RND transporter periplasmic adaptor subunit [Chloroflexota bacterium]
MAGLAPQPVTDTLPTTPTLAHDGYVDPGARRHPRRPPRAALLLPLVVIVGMALWLLRAQPTSGPLTASGTIELDEVTLAAQMSGRIAELTVDEGSNVFEGQVVGQLSDPVLEVQLKQAIVDPAQQQVVQAQMSRLELRTPLGGVVQKRIAHKGEFVGPGAPILTIADPTDLKLTLYVLEGDLGHVNVGQTISLRADAFPDRVFSGLVRTIATRAEFTPRNVQTQKDRQNLVFGVTVGVPNPDGALKAGLPVDATFDQ